MKVQFYPCLWIVDFSQINGLHFPALLNCKMFKKCGQAGMVGSFVKRVILACPSWHQLVTWTKTKAFDWFVCCNKCIVTVNFDHR